MPLCKNKCQFFLPSLCFWNDVSETNYLLVSALATSFNSFPDLLVTYLTHLHCSLPRGQLPVQSCQCLPQDSLSVSLKCDLCLSLQPPFVLFPKILSLFLPESHPLHPSSVHWLPAILLTGVAYKKFSLWLRAPLTGIQVMFPASHSRSQLPITPFPGNHKPYSDLCRDWGHMCYTCTQASNLSYTYNK